MKIKIELYGEMYEQKCNVYYKEQILYSGYVDNLVTSVNGYLELKLNYGTNITTPTIIKRLGNIILWIPTDNIKLNEKYLNVIISIEEMAEIWKMLGYELKDDMYLINYATNKDLKSLWVANSGIRLYIENTSEALKIIENNSIGFNYDSKEVHDYINYLIKEDWDELEVNFINKIDLPKDKLVIYIDYLNILTEWIPLVNEEKHYDVINLGSNYIIKFIGQ